MKQKNLYFYTNFLAWGLVLFLVCNYVFGWTTPSANPPSSNLSAPINVSSTAQTKTGSLTVEGLLKIGQYSSSPSGSIGQLYFDTTENEFKGYKSTGWDSIGGGAGLWTLTGSDIYYNTGNVGIGTTSPGAKLDVAGGLNLTDQIYTLHDSVRTFENVAGYYNENTQSTGTIVITIGSTPNMMLEAEIVVQGYNGLTKCQIRGYTYTASTTWHMPGATCLSSGHDGGYTVRFGKRISDNARVILIGTTSSNWGNYPHVIVTRVTYGHPGSGSSIGNWSISMVTNESAYSDIASVNVNSGFSAYNPKFTGSVTAPAFYYSSDETLKKNVQKIETSLAKIMKLDGISFDWKESGEKSMGLIAQDVEKVFPEIVKTDEETGLKSVEYGKLVAPLIEATKEQQKMIDEQKELINKQGEEIKKLKVLFEQL